jgi:EmrB/QacA subfamily drug resistance transporter
MPQQVSTSSVRPDRWKILPVVLLSPFMGCLDGSIVNVALPTMAKELGVGLDSVQWTVSSYLIVVSALVLVFGKVADLLGKKRVFVWGFLVFGSGSLLCALAWNLPVLIAARSFQAIGAAMFMSSNQGIIATIFPPEERGRALGLMGTTVAVGTMVGPPLGGIMVELFGWPSLFLINIPISLFAFIAGAAKLPQEERKGSLAGFDLAGAALFTLFVVGLFYYLLDGQSSGWAAPAELASLAAAALCLALFLRRERRVADPMLDLSIFRSGLFSASVLCVLLVFCSSFCVNIVQPFYLQDVLGLSPAMAGIILLASPLASGAIAPLSGYLADRVGGETLTVAGLLVELASLAGMSFLGAHSSPLWVALCLAIFGVGQGIFSSPNTKLIMAHAPHDKLGIAGSINALARNMGMVSGIAFAVSILYGVMSARLGYKVSGFVPGSGEAFVAGMRIAFVSAACLMAVAIALTVLRVGRSRSSSANASA